MLALTRFFGGFIIGINISSVVVEAALEDVIPGVEAVVEVVIEVVVKVAVRPWLWPGLGLGAATPAAVSTGLPPMGSLSSPIKKGAYIKNGLIISIRL